MFLLSKELRSLRPFLWLVLVILGIDLIGTLLTRFPDQFSISDAFDEFDASFAYAIHLVFALAMGQTLIQRERSEETLEFVDSLPVSRSQVFWTKWLAGYIILALFILASFATDLPLHFWSRSSDDPSIYVEFWGPMLVMDLVVNAIYLSLGMALAFWGRFGLLAGAFYLMGVWIAKSAGIPAMDRLDPTVFGQFQVTGSSLQVPWRILFEQLSVSLLIAFIGQWAFLRFGKSLEKPGLLRRAATPVFILGCSVAVVVWLVAGIVSQQDEPLPDPDASETPIYAEWETSRLKTDGFVFIYPNNLARAAEELAAEADTIHETVTRFFDTEPQRELVVDLTSQSPRHAGTAYWGRIRMNLQAEGLESRLPAVLGHELSHIYIDQLSENRIAENFDATRFFHEGLASVLEYRYFRPAEELSQIRRLAAAAADRHQIRFEDLVSSSALSEKYAGEWVYPLGEIFASGIIETWGDEAPARLIRAFSRSGAPKGLQGIPLWQDSFQAAGYDLEIAIAAFYRLLETTVASERAWLDRLPRLRGQLISDGKDRVGVRILSNPIGKTSKSPKTLPSRREILVRFRSGPHAPETEYQTRRLDSKHTAWISRKNFPGKIIQFQIAHSPKGNLMMPLFDEWVSTRLPDPP